MCKCIWGIFWALVLIFVAYPVGFFVAGFYVLFCPLQACCDACSGLVEFLLKMTQLPLICAKKMCNGEGLC